MNAATQEEYCGTFYAAKVLGMSVGTVQALVQRGELKAWRTQGGHRRISLESIRDYQRAQGVPELPQRSAHLRVLVVEDDPASLEMFRNAIASWSLPVDCTSMTSAMEALIDIGNIKPDVLVTDLLMPGVDGFELLRALHANPSFSSMVLVAMTGLAEDEIRAKGGLPGSTVTMPKPIDLEWLRGFLTALCVVRQLTNDNAHRP